MPIERITSLTNPRVKNIIKIRDHRNRTGKQLSLVDGMREFAAAIRAKIRLEEVYLCRELLTKEEGEELTDTANDLAKKIAAQRVPIFEVSKDVFMKMSFGERESGVLALIESKTHEIQSLRLKSNPLVVVLETVEKPGNLGAILRTADAVGADAVIVCDMQTDIYNPNVIRSSLGTIFSLPVVVASKEDTVSFLKNSRIKICATVVDTRTLYTKVNFHDAIAIVLGSEQNGLSDFWKQHADMNVKIPMKGKADSLNVSVTAAVLLYEAVRQRGE
jgi:TrmH family RNA methyltransferase